MFETRRDSKRRYDLAIIGGGAGGLVVASVSAQLGLKTLLIEKEAQLGGDCLHYGCVPSKALLRCAQVASELRRAEVFGFTPVEPGVDLQRVNAYIRRVVDHIQVHDSHRRFRELGCEILTGEARFVDAYSVAVGNELVHAKRFVIATGSHALVPAIDGIDTVEYLTNEHMYTLDALPARLLVLGGGPVGVEIAQAYARLGSRVTLVEQQARILPGFNAAVSAVLSRALEADGVSLCHGKLTGLRSSVRETVAILDDGSELAADRLLIALGRRAVVQNLGLENAGIDFDARGVRVNARMQTSQRHIYACGDVTGVMPFTHVAEQQAGVVIANAVFRLPKRMDYRVVPAVVYTDPECAMVGITPEAAAGDHRYRVVEFDFGDLDRAVTENATGGLVMLVARRGRLAGAQVIGPHAGELIHELALAVQQRLKLSMLSTLIHAYPSWSQGNRRAAGLYFRDSLFSPATKRLVRFMNALPW